MAHSINKLSARFVQTTQKPGKVADGGGLYLQVSKTGSKSWLFRFMLNGCSREMGLGSVNRVSLAKAREQAAECRMLLGNKIDPIEYRISSRKSEEDGSKVIRFKEAALRYIEAHEISWKNKKHASQWRNTLQTYVFPVFGELDVSAIKTDDVVEVLYPIWKAKTETAARIRGRIERILDWAAVSGFRSGENPARWNGHLQNLLPAQASIRTVQHHKAMPYDDLPAFINSLKELQGISAKALEFLIYTATRTSETIGARWLEIDLKNEAWTIPAERTKTNSEHRVPLSQPALSLLNSLYASGHETFVFPSDNRSRGLSDMAMLQVLRRMSIPYTVHGFRSSFRDWTAEQTDVQREVAEQALGHAIGNKVEAAYRRSDLFEKRRALMDNWARFLTCVNKNE
jgi:integrase